MALTMAVAGCFNPHIEPGKVTCTPSDNQCPSGFMCVARMGAPAVCCRQPDCDDQQDAAAADAPDARRASGGATAGGGASGGGGATGVSGGGASGAAGRGAMGGSGGAVAGGSGGAATGGAGGGATGGSGGTATGGRVGTGGAAATGASSGGAAGGGGATGAAGGGGSRDAGADQAVDAPTLCADGTAPPCCPTGEVKCGSQCVNLKTSAANCGECGNVCTSDQLCKLGLCKGNTGAVCSSDAGCVGGACNFYYRDDDGDTYGADSKKTGFCGLVVTPLGYSLTAGDCCDDGAAANKAESALIHPGADWQTTKATACNIGWDYNCSGKVDAELPGGTVVLHCEFSGGGGACASSYSTPVEADCGVASASCATSCFTVGSSLCVCGHYSDPKVHCR